VNLNFILCKTDICQVRTYASTEKIEKDILFWVYWYSEGVLHVTLPSASLHQYRPGWLLRLTSLLRQYIPEHCLSLDILALKSNQPFSIVFQKCPWTFLILYNPRSHCCATVWTFRLHCQSTMVSNSGSWFMRNVRTDRYSQPITCSLFSIARRTPKNGLILRLSGRSLLMLNLLLGAGTVNKLTCCCRLKRPYCLYHQCWSPPKYWQKADLYTVSDKEMGLLLLPGDKSSSLFL
jgi:hypothetical protein